MKTTTLNLLRALPAALLLLHFAACKSESSTGANTRRAVDPVLASNVPFRDFNIDAVNGDTIDLPEGTSIYIPGGIFADKNGKPVNGNVQLHYRAFYTLGEIIASGITMIYDTAGDEHVFTSAGMFEISGTQDGQPVNIRPGKSITMDFASYRNDIDFNFYSLDTATAAWTFKSTTKAEPNRLRMSLEKALAAISKKPAEPRAYDPSRPVINLDMDTEDHPELAGYSNIVWQYAGKGSDPEKNSWIYNTAWTSARLTIADSSTCMYNIGLSDGTRTFSTCAFPALKGNNYQAAMADFKKRMTAFESSEKERQEKRRRLEATSAFQRRLTVQSMGIHNCDIFDRLGKRLRKRLRFLFNEPSLNNQKDAFAVYVVTGNKRVVSGYIASSEPMVDYLEGQYSFVIAIQRETNKVFTAGNDAFTKAASSGDEQSVSPLTLQATSYTVKNTQELDDLISKL